MKLAACLMPEGLIGKRVCTDGLLQTFFSSYEVQSADIAEGAVKAELGLRAGDRVCGTLASAMRTNSYTFPLRHEGGEALKVANGTQLVLSVFVTVDDNTNRVLLVYTFTVRAAVG